MNTVRLGAYSPKRRTSTQGSTSGSEIKHRKHRPDYRLLVYMGLLLAAGAITVYAISPGLTLGRDLSENYYSTKQLTAIAIGIVAFLVAANLSIKRWKELTWVLISLAAISAVAVRFVGEEINGAYRWVQVGGLSFQAAELIKLALLIWLAGFLVKMRMQNKLDDKEAFKQIAIAVGIVGFVVAGLQSDLGSAIVMMAMVLSMTLIAGMSLKKLGIMFLILVVLGSVAIATSPYRRDRINTYLNPTADCQNEGYQSCQALITVGSGGMFGRGAGRSVQAYGYLPVAANDSIFAIISENWGFVGSVAIISIFVGLFRRMKLIAMNAPNDYTKLLVVGILTWLSVQMIINIGAMIGLLPLKGITLPFVSYGGTSIMFVMIAVGIVFNISRYSDLSEKTSKRKSTGRRVHNPLGQKWSAES